MCNDWRSCHMTYWRHELVTMETVQLMEQTRRAHGRRVTQALSTLRSFDRNTAIFVRGKWHTMQFLNSPVQCPVGGATRSVASWLELTGVACDVRRWRRRGVGLQRLGRRWVGLEPCSLVRRWVVGLGRCERLSSVPSLTSGDPVFSSWH